MLPSGTVTFLFTDIEGSTERWDRDATAMRAALGLHDRILDATIARHGGQVLKGKGDGVIAVFSEARGAVDAAIDAQRQLVAETWPPEVAPIRARMAIHTGTAVAEDGDYHAHDVNRAARLESAAHGGQIVISESTASLLRADLGPGCELVDLGEYRLRGLSRPMRIYQVVVPDLPRRFPPLRVRHASTTTLPVFATPFLDRAEEMARMAELLASPLPAVITVTGPGGVGKTRLAVEAARAADGFVDGAAFVSLDDVADVESMIGEVMVALGVGVDAHSSDLAPRVQLLDYVAGRALLLVLDNLEQVGDAAGFLTELLARSPETKVVVTSRRRLGLQAEWVVDVGGLPIEDAEDQPAVDLFVTLAARRGVVVDPQADRDTIAEVCRVLDGVPLAIELAASWLPTLTPADIRDELGQGLGVLEATSPDMPERHRSMRAVFEQSWRLLDDEDRAGLAKLTAFAGTFDRKAAAAVAGVDLRMLTRLVDNSLVDSSITGRFRVRRTTREFAAEAVEDHTRLRQLHGDYYIGLLRELAPHLRGGPRQVEARRRLLAERANLERGFDWLVVTGEEATVLEMLPPIETLFATSGWHDGRRVFLRLSAAAAEARGAGDSVTRALRTLAAAYAAFTSDVDAASQEIGEVMPEWEQEGGPWLGLCHFVKGIVAAERGHAAEARRDFELARDLTPDDRRRAAIGLWLGWALLEQGHVDEARDLWQHTEDTYRRLGDTVNLSFALSKLGLAADASGEHRRALKYHQEAHDAFVELGDRAGMAYTLTRSSWSHWLLGEHAAAKEAALDALRLFQELGHRWGVAATLMRLGFAELGLGEVDAAADHFREGLSRAEASHLDTQRVYALLGMAWVAEARGDLEVAARLAGWLDAFPGTMPTYRRFYLDPLVERLRSGLGDAYGSLARRDAGRDLDTIAAEFA